MKDKSTREILTDSIVDHKRAIAKAEKELAESEVTYSIGDRFVCGGNKYILGTCGGKQVVMLNLSGKPHDRGVWEPVNEFKISQKEFNDKYECSYSCYTRYWDARKRCRV